MNTDKFMKFYDHEISGVEEAKEFEKAVMEEAPSTEYMEDWKSENFNHAGDNYNLDNLGFWWAYLIGIETPQQTADKLVNDCEEGNKGRILSIGQGSMCSLIPEVLGIKQVLFPELALESLRADIAENVYGLYDEHYSQPVIHYSDDNKTANVFFVISGMLVESDEPFTMNFVIVCKKAK